MIQWSATAGTTNDTPDADEGGPASVPGVQVLGGRVELVSTLLCSLLRAAGCAPAPQHPPFHLAHAPIPLLRLLSPGGRAAPVPVTQCRASQGGVSATMAGNIPKG